MRERHSQIGVASRLAIATVLALMISASDSAMAEDSSHGSRPNLPSQPMPDEAQKGMETPGFIEEPIPGEGVPPATETKGGQPLAYEVVDGVKVFRLTARPVKWQISPEIQVAPGNLGNHMVV